MKPEEEQSAPALAVADAKETETVALQKTLRGGTLTSIEIREPTAGEMRGLSLQDVVRADVNTMIALLPKITNPPITALEVESQMKAADLIALAGAVAGFFYSAQEKQMLAKVMGQIEESPG